MSAPARKPDDAGPANLDEGPSKERPPNNDGRLQDGPANDGPLKYAPKRARQPRQDQNLSSASRSVSAELPEPPWRGSRKRGVFAGDVATADLRHQLGLAPDRVPHPPASKPVRIFGAKGRFIGAVAVAAAGAVGYVWGSAPRTSPPASVRTDLAPSASAQSASVGEAQRTTPTPDQRTAALAPAASPPPSPAQGASAPPASAPRPFVTQPDGQNSRDAASAPTALPQLTVKAVRRWQPDEPARLPFSAADAGSNVHVMIDGLAPGSTLSAGTPAGPNRWRLSAKDLNKTTVTPPRGFAGVMDLTLELRLADDSFVDRQSFQLEWSGKSALVTADSSQRQLSEAEIAVMMKRGIEYMANGNIGAARLMFQPVAEAGEAMAAFALAETYDPSVLEKLGATGGIRSDVALAQRWYEKAKDLGSAVAPERLLTLTRRSGLNRLEGNRFSDGTPQSQ